MDIWLFVLKSPHTYRPMGQLVVAARTPNEDMNYIAQEMEHEAKRPESYWRGNDGLIELSVITVMC